MTDSLRLQPTLRVLLLGALAAYCAVTLAAPPAHAAEPTISYTKESIGQYEKQLAAGEIREVTINKRERSLRTTLKNGEHVLAKYAKKQEPKYASALEAKGVPVKTLTPTQAKAEQKSKPVHHKLRYIAAAVLVVILIIVGVVLFMHRRRKAVLD
jgi:flagellar basal body-associated protein FliL